jgi:hypothetical protein
MSASNFTDRTQPYQEVYLSAAVVELSSHVVLNIIRIVTIILLLLWRKKQPLRTRHPIPILLILVEMLLYEPSSIIDLVRFMVDTGGAALFSDTLRFTTLVALHYVVLNLFVRYYIIKNLNRLKINISTQNTNNISKIRYQFYKFITSQLALYLGLFIIIAEQLAICILLASLSGVGSIPSATALLAEIIQGSAHMGVLGVIILLFILWEVIPAVRERGMKGVLSYNDPLNIRLDSVFFILAVLFGMAGAACFVTQQQLPYSDKTNVLKAVLFFFFTVLLILMNVFLLLASGLSCILLILKRDYFSKEKALQVDEENEMEKVLNDSTGRKLFEKYCDMEFSSENYLALVSLLVYLLTSSRNILKCTKKQTRVNNMT